MNTETEDYCSKSQWNSKEVSDSYIKEVTCCSLRGASICSASTTLSLSLVNKLSGWQSHRQCTSKNMKVAKCSPSREGMWCFVYMREHLSVWMIYIKRASLSGSTSPYVNRGEHLHMAKWVWWWWHRGRSEPARLQSLLWSPPPLWLRTGTHQKGN